jgi:SAM-dependent methyltransferase
MLDGDNTMRNYGHALQADSIYRCPLTGLHLMECDEGLATTEGEQRYRIRRGVPIFLRFPPAEDEAVRRKLDRLNDLAAAAGWRTALDEIYGTEPDLLRYVTDPRRLKLLDLLPLDGAQRILEIGPGFGQFTAALADRVAQVYALEVFQGQAEFALQRAQQSGAANVAVACGGDNCDLPYLDEAFDGVVLNLVLEWCGSRCTSRSLLASQQQMLCEISRVLRPGGFVFVATKNRYSLHYLLGKRDEHMWDMRFGSALPRPLTSWLCRRRGHSRSRGYLHSHNSLARLLMAAGFDRLQPYWAVPEMRYPDRYIPADGASVRAVRREGGLTQGTHRMTRLLMPWVPARWVRHVTPGLVFLARKSV